MSPRVNEADQLLNDAVAMAGEGMAETAPNAAEEFFKQFLPMPRQVKLKLTECRTFKSGCVLLRYRVQH